MIYLQKHFFFILLISITSFTHAQEEAAILEVVHQLQRGIQTKNTAILSDIILPNAQLTSLVEEEKGSAPKLLIYSKPEFIEDFKNAKKINIDEKMQNIQINISGNFATATADYSFHINGKQTHCGINYIHFYKTNNQWKITSITDTRNLEKCTKETTTDDKKIIDNFINDWHLAATQADAETFFGMMASDGIYIGTDETEYWLRDELRSWAKGAFEQKPAWDFKKISRNIYLSPDGNTAWWDEKLDTWMGVCRGSGVLTLTTNGWKIKHYHLAVTLPNDKVKRFIKLVKKGKKKR